MLSIPEMEMFAILYADNSSPQLVYTRNGTDWTRRTWLMSEGTPGSFGLSLGWSPVFYNMVIYGLLPGKTKADLTNVYSFTNSLIDLTAMVSRRAPIRLGTTTDTGLALYTGSNRPQLTILPGEGGVEVQTKLVIGNTEITEAQLAKLLALIS
jgi:hypothetical protein